MKSNDETRLFDLRELLSREPNHPDAYFMRAELTQLENAKAQENGFNRAHSPAEQTLLSLTKKVVILQGVSLGLFVACAFLFTHAFTQTTDLKKANAVLAQRLTDEHKLIVDLQEFEYETLDYLSDLDAEIAGLDY